MATATSQLGKEPEDATLRDGAGPVDPVAPRPGARRQGGPRTATVVTVLGEILLTLGFLLALFLVWQLWWTDVVADREQAEVIEGLGWARADGSEPGETGSTTPLGSRDSGHSGPSDVAAVGPRRDAAPVPAQPDEIGTTFATLQVPRWGADYIRPISEGTTRREVLDPLGIGHYTDTGMPGEVGNSKPFRRVEELEVGDPLVVQTETTWYVYRVTSTRIVDPTAVEVIAPVPGDPDAAPTEAMMTLTTCHPVFSAEQRFIVHSSLDYWMPVTDGLPAELTTIA